MSLCLLIPLFSCSGQFYKQSVIDKKSLSLQIIFEVLIFAIVIVTVFSEMQIGYDYFSDGAASILINVSIFLFVNVCFSGVTSNIVGNTKQMFFHKST
jgi:hypothetical protein